MSGPVKFDENSETIKHFINRGYPIQE